MFNSLISEILDFADRQCEKDKIARALRLYVRCLRKHPKSAQAIEAKYGHLFPKCDATIAAGFALMQAKKRQ